jgi:hypothetical protein
MSNECCLSVGSRNETSNVHRLTKQIQREELTQRKKSSMCRFFECKISKILHENKKSAETLDRMNVVKVWIK